MSADTAVSADEKTVEASPEWASPSHRLPKAPWSLFPALAVQAMLIVVPLGIMFVYSFWTSRNYEIILDWTLVHAAEDLGASPARAFQHVTLPQTMPGIISATVLTSFRRSGCSSCRS